MNDDRVLGVSVLPPLSNNGKNAQSPASVPPLVAISNSRGSVIKRTMRIVVSAVRRIIWSLRVGCVVRVVRIRIVANDGSRVTSVKITSIGNANVGPPSINNLGICGFAGSDQKDQRDNDHAQKQNSMIHCVAPASLFVCHLRPFE